MIVRLLNQIASALSDKRHEILHLWKEYRKRKEEIEKYKKHCKKNNSCYLNYYLNYYCPPSSSEVVLLAEIKEMEKFCILYHENKTCQEENKIFTSQAFLSTPYHLSKAFTDEILFLHIPQMKQFYKSYKKNKGNKGYSLIELAIALTILSVLITSGLTVVSHINNHYKVKVTNERIYKIQEALQTFYQANGYIPCPAPASALESDSYFGTSEASYFSTTTNSCVGGAGALATAYGTGMVPVRSLYLSDEYAYDGWERKFAYRVADGLGSPLTFADSRYRSTIKITDLNGIEKTSLYMPAPNNYGAAYVIISFGADGANVAWGKNSTTPPSQGTGYEAYNTDNSRNQYIQNSATSQFDDIVAFATKLAFINVKKGASPIFMPQYICSNAQNFVMQNAINPIKLSASGNISSGFANKFNNNFLNSAKTVQQLCQSAPSTVCMQNPANVSNLVVWLDGNNPNGPGNSPPADGSTITTWYNGGSSGNNAGSPTGHPTYLSSSYLNNSNGPMGAIEFNGSSSLTIDFSFLQNSDYTVFLLISNDPYVICGGPAISGINSAPNQNLSLGFVSSAEIITSNNPESCVAYYGQYQNDMFAPLPLKYNYNTEPAILVARLNSNTANGPVMNDLRMLTRSNEYFYNIKTSNVNQLSSYGSQMIGKSFTGQIGEIIVYNRAITDEEIYSVLNYLANKWFEGNCSW